MKTGIIWALVLMIWMSGKGFAQESVERYIEVTGTAELEIVPDEIHFLIEIREYFEEEFDGHSKPEDYRTKVPLQRIETQLRAVLKKVGVAENDVRVQDVGDYWRESGRDFQVSKQLDIRLKDFKQIDELVRRLDTKGVRSMRVGELHNKDLSGYRKQGKVEALKAAKEKAAYLAEASGMRLGTVLRIVEADERGAMPYYAGNVQSNIAFSNAQSFDNFRTIKLRYSMLVRFQLADWVR